MLYRCSHAISAADINIHIISVPNAEPAPSALLWLLFNPPLDPPICSPPFPVSLASSYLGPPNG